MSKILMIAALAAGLGIQTAQAHCDSLTGRVALAAEKALQDGNVNPVLAYVPAAAEAEVRSAFETSREVRSLSRVARALADRAFMETVIRLHQAGEGTAYTGLKPAGQDHGPVVEAAERAVKTGDLTELKAMLTAEIEQALDERLAHVRALQSATLEPKTEAEVPASRARVRAEIAFVNFAEALRRTARHGAPRHLTEPDVD